MAKPKKIKAVMEAPAHRNLVQLAHRMHTPKAGTHKDEKKVANKSVSRKKYDSKKDGW